MKLKDFFKPKTALAYENYDGYVECSNCHAYNRYIMVGGNSTMPKHCGKCGAKFIGGRYKFNASKKGE